MTIDYYHSTFVKQWKAMLLCFLVVILGVLLVSQLMTPVYQVSALMQITPHLVANQPDSSASLAADRLLQTESQLALSEAVLREVASHFQGITPEQLMRKTQVTPQTNTQLFAITVQDTSPARAAALANDIAQTLLDQQARLNTQAATQAVTRIQQDLDNVQQHIELVTNQIARLQQQNKGSPQLIALQTQLGGLQQHYNQLQNAQAQLELLAAQNSNTLQCVQLALPDGRLVRPIIPLNLLASLPIALSLSILLALALEACNTHVRTPEALSLLLQWPVLAPIWRIRGIVERQELVHLPDQEPSNVESYRALRANLSFSSIDRSLRTLVVTSAAPGDGKSVVAANLAISMARVGKNTLLIDADLRRPVLHELFSIDADKMGLSDAILTANVSEANSRRLRAQFLTPLSQGNTLGLPRAPRFSIDSFVHDAGIPNLRIMPAGTLPPNPAELLDSRAMQRLFIALEQSDADVIIFDTPPLQHLSDASILASRVDGTLVVVDASRARKGQLKQLKFALTQSGAHVLGCVMNKLRPGRYEASYSYSYEQEELDEQLSVEPVVASRAVIAAASVASAARLHMLSSSRSTTHVSLLGSRRSIRRRSRR
jgi:Mrp family chromosome partitioning ATPase/capsular polysaccharide biosynthesis protein